MLQIGNVACDIGKIVASTVNDKFQVIDIIVSRERIKNHAIPFANVVPKLIPEFRVNVI